MDNTNLWEGLWEKDDDAGVLLRGQDSIKSWGNNLLAVGEAAAEKCSYTIHSMKLTKGGEWEYVKEKPTPPRGGGRQTIQSLETSGTTWMTYYPQDGPSGGELK